MVNNKVKKFQEIALKTFFFKNQYFEQYRSKSIKTFLTVIFEKKSSVYNINSKNM